MKATIVSLLPYETRHTFPNCVPQEFIIPAAKSEKEPGMLAIPDVKFSVYIDSERPPIPQSRLAYDAALSVCHDVKNAQFLVELGIQEPGLFAVEGDWTERYWGVMDVLSEAKEKGGIRAHGCSCHSIEALRAAAKSPWVDVDLVRINPIGSHMDADPETVVGVLRQMKASGKGIIGMKILGQGDLRTRQDEALKYALSLGVLDAFTIGAENRAEQEDLIRRIGAVA
jgi:hypothetical protein